jgi:hypothetical protein
MQGVARRTQPAESCGRRVFRAVRAQRDVRRIE